MQKQQVTKRYGFVTVLVGMPRLRKVTVWGSKVTVWAPKVTVSSQKVTVFSFVTVSGGGGKLRFCYGFGLARFVWLGVLHSAMSIQKVAAFMLFLSIHEHKGDHFSVAAQNMQGMSHQVVYWIQCCEIIVSMTIPSSTTSITITMTMNITSLT